MTDDEPILRALVDRTGADRGRVCRALDRVQTRMEIERSDEDPAGLALDENRTAGATAHVAE